MEAREDVGRRRIIFFYEGSKKTDPNQPAVRGVIELVRPEGVFYRTEGDWATSMEAANLSVLLRLGERFTDNWIERDRIETRALELEAANGRLTHDLQVARDEAEELRKENAELKDDRMELTAKVARLERSPFRVLSSAPSPELVNLLRSMEQIREVIRDFDARVES